MAKQSDEQLYQTLTRTSSLMKAIKPIEGEEYTLESILAEYGKGAAKPAQKKKEITQELPKVEKKSERQKEEPAQVNEAASTKQAEVHEKHKIKKSFRNQETVKLEKIQEGDTISLSKKEKDEKNDTVTLDNVKKVRVKKISRTEDKRPKPEETKPTEHESNAPPDRVSLKDIMYTTVDSVLSENDDAIIDQPKTIKERVDEIKAHIKNPKQKVKRKDTEQLWEETAATENFAQNYDEPEIDEVARFERRRCKHLNRALYLSAVPTIVLVVISILDMLGWLPALWQQNCILRNGILGGLLLMAALFGSDAFKEAFDESRDHRIVSGLGAFILTLVVLADCVVGAVLNRTDSSPMAAPAAVLIWICLYAMLKAADARREAYHLIDLGRTPPFTVSKIDAGACRQKGRLEGFIHTTEKHTPAERIQSILGPLFVGIATILAGLVTIQSEQMARILWNWSVLLTVAIPLAMPLTTTLPLAWLQHRLTRDGCAIAGYAGAQKFRTVKRIVLTDTDLFPKGTVEFNGYKVFSEERSKVISYAASIAKEAGSQLTDMFTQQLAAEGGFRTKVDDFHFYEEGGVGATIQGESVLMGSAFFMRKQHVLLPKDVKLQTGVFMAIDGALASIFVIKYQPSRNVEWSLRALRRARIRPILAVRSGNITPGMIKRKFGLDTKAIYPKVTTRIALSDVANTHDAFNDVVLYRDGIMSLVEVVIGAKRMLNASKIARWLTNFSGLAGVFLANYLIRAGAIAALSQFNVLIFGLLWLLPTILLAGLVRNF